MGVASSKPRPGQSSSQQNQNQQQRIPQQQGQANFPPNNYYRANNTRYPSTSAANTTTTRTISNAGVPPKPSRHMLAEFGDAENNSRSNREAAASSSSRPKSPHKRTSPIKASLLQDLLECPVCMNLFENPHVLPCQHTFCKPCINIMYKPEAKSLDCPICRARHALPNGAEALTANFTIKRLIEFETQQQQVQIQQQIKAAESLEKKINLARQQSQSKSSGGGGSGGVKAKCFACQRFTRLRVCEDCAYMLCYDCVENPDHDYIIESKLNARRRTIPVSSKIKTTTPFKRAYVGPEQQRGRYDLYAAHHHHQQSSPRRSISSQPTAFHIKLNLIILCHSTAVEESMQPKIASNKKRPVEQYSQPVLEEDEDKEQRERFITEQQAPAVDAQTEAEEDSEREESEYAEDEYGNKCSTYTQLELDSSDRVITLKKIVEAKFGIGLDDQILVYKDRIVKNELTQLFALNMSQFSRVHVFDKRDLNEYQNEADLLANANSYGIYQNLNKPTTGNSFQRIIPTRQAPLPPLPPTPEQNEAMTEQVRHNSLRRKYSTLTSNHFDPGRYFDEGVRRRESVSMRQQQQVMMPTVDYRFNNNFNNGSVRGNRYFNHQQQQQQQQQRMQQPIYAQYGQLLAEKSFRNY